MQKEKVQLSKYLKLEKLMETGEPVCISFETEEGNTKEGLHGTASSQKQYLSREQLLKTKWSG